VDLRQLRYFITIAELGSFTDAAERLRIAQSALSRAVGLLEKELGVRLFERKARGVAVSRAGHLLWEHAKSILLQVEHARADVAAEAKVLSGEVSLGTWASMGRLIFGQLAESFLSEFPHVSLKLREGQPYTLLDGLAAGWLDLAIMVDAKTTKELHHEPLFSDPIYLVGPPRDPSMPREIKGIEDIKDIPLVLMQRPNGSRTLCDAAAQRAGFALTVRHEVGSTAVVNDFVCRGLGFGLLPYSSIVEQMRSGTLATAHIPGLSVARILVRRADRAPSPIVSELSRHVHAVFDDLRRQGRICSAP
jgi:LysR family transcriptional regulator, nitrogen assimilation regulatory protein